MSSLLSLARNVNLRAFNTLGVAATARSLVRVTSDREVRDVVNDAVFGPAPKRVLGAGSNVVLTGDVEQLVVKVEVPGMRLLETGRDAWIVEVGAGENWHATVAWTLAMGWPGLENLALIPGTVGAAPVQNIGAYGVELKDRFHSLDAIDLITGRSVTLDASACRFGYRDSVFKQALAGKSVITRVRLALPRPWQPVLGYHDLERRAQEAGTANPAASRIFEWVCAIRRAKLPDPALLGNAGSFFKNPVVTPEIAQDIIARDPSVVHYSLPDGSVKLAAAWMIDACGWRGKRVGDAGVYEHQALVLVNHGQASGAEIVTLARAIQTSVYGRFGIRLEPEPVLW